MNTEQVNSNGVPIATQVSRGCSRIFAADQELNQTKTLVDGLLFTNPVEMTAVPNNEHNRQVLQTIQLDDFPIFQEMMNEFNIYFGSEEFPRFCCACHKLNLAVR